MGEIRFGIRLDERIYIYGKSNKVIFIRFYYLSNTFITLLSVMLYAYVNTRWKRLEPYDSIEIISLCKREVYSRRRFYDEYALSR